MYKNGLIQLLIAGALIGDSTLRSLEPRTFTGDREPIIPDGCSVYEFSGVKIIARSYENALKKAKKKGLV